MIYIYRERERERESIIVKQAHFFKAHTRKKFNGKLFYVLCITIYIYAYMCA